MAIVTNRVGILLAERSQKEKRRITHKEVAEAINKEFDGVVYVSEGSVSNWAFNRVSRFDSDPIIGFCWYFGVDINELLDVPTREKLLNPNPGQEMSVSLAA